MSNTKVAVIEGLSQLLADTYVLYVKTQNFHWNVTGSDFYPLHKMFEEQYEQLSEATDLLAERIRALNAKAPGSLADFLKLSSLQESTNDLSAKDQVRVLLEDHEKIAGNIEKLFETASSDGDEVTLDMLIERKTEHDKTAWMLRSSLV